MAGPLSGVKVVDVSAMMAGPFSTMILAEQGADVIKVEPIAGDFMRRMATGGHEIGPLAYNTNRGKRSIALDLKSPAGIAVAHRLIASADVFVENFRAGVADRLGLGYKQLSADNPRLIYARSGGMGNKGPAANRRVYDPIIQAAAGMCHAQANKDGPQLMHTIVADKLSPTMMAQAITSALYERSQSGRGQHIDMSMLHATIWWMWADLMMGHTYTHDDDKHTISSHEVQKPLFQTEDGHIILIWGDDGDWAATCKGIGRPELITDERFSSAAGRLEHRVELKQIVEAVLKTAKSEVWYQRLADSDAAFGAINSPKSLLTDPQVVANEMFTELKHEQLGTVRTPTPPAQFSRTPSKPGFSPRVGEHSREILAELAYSAHEVTELIDTGVVR